MAARYNALAPLSPKQQQALATRYVRAQYGPLLSQINQGYAQRAQAGSAAIQRGTSALAASLAPMAGQTQQIYSQAQSAQSAIDNAIASKLAAAGQATQADVGGQLAAAGQAPSPTNLAQVGAGAGAASFGMGSAPLSRLVAEGAARTNYSASLPGLAQMGGAYRAQDLALQLEHGRQSDTQALLAKEPGTIAQVQQQIQQNEFNKAAANLTYGTNMAKLTQQGNIASANAAAKINPATGRPWTYDASIARIKATAGKQGRSYDDNLSRAAGHAVDHQGRPIVNPATGNPYKYVPKPTQPKALSPQAVSTMRGHAIDAARALKHGSPNPNYDPNSKNYHKGVPDTQQTVYPRGGGPSNPAQAYQYLRRHGVRDDIARFAVAQTYGHLPAGLGK